MTKWIGAAALAAAFLVPATAVAQSAAGVRAGARWSQLETSHDAGSHTGLVVGGYFGFGVSNRLAIQVEAVYGSRGGDALLLGADAIDPNADPAGVEMRYIEVPVLLRAGFPGDRFLPSFFLGPYVAFLLDCELQPADAAARACDEDGAAQRFGPRSTDYGMIVGGGLDMAMGESTVFLDARYTLGLLPIASGDDAIDVRHTGLAISGGFAVPIGR